MEDNGIIVARSRGGLCNNLKCYLSAARLAEQRNATLLTDCTDLQVIFSNIRLIDTAAIPDQALSHCDWRLVVTEQDNLPAGFSRSRESRGFKDADPEHRNIDFEYSHIPPSLRQIYLRLLHDLEIKPPLLDYVNAFSKQHFDSNTISIHMRTWLTDSWDQAPKRHALFFDISQYRTIIEQHLPGKIFLSSDNSQFANRLVAEYGSGILIYQPPAQLNSMELAFINLLLLSANSRLFGSRISTFTEMAWWYSDCKSQVTLL